ncbi:hypothetical protein SS50377_24322 [Spironucleus salmonicida]|uniref:Uncharacterized protein n=1 Tax=Spironucleus salmonicida TaxID=348837 RepID=V6LQZ3_9EUKA|nr:hypothetical protein SS50377_24322 [Spironucleus salmonicida]|eukprot:EST46126.1 Hypothetical protein SS50377_14121 [Spironucleus salmonicida]
MGSDDSKQDCSKTTEQASPQIVQGAQNMSETPKQDPFDPRSPNVEQHRTPFVQIQDHDQKEIQSLDQKNTVPTTPFQDNQEPANGFFDPRSPTAVVQRTPFAQQAQGPQSPSDVMDIAPLENHTPTE